MSVQFTDLTNEDKLWGMLGYIPFVGWIIAIVALLMEDKKVRPYIKFHSVQSLALAIINGVVAGVLTAIVIGPCIGLAGVIYMCYIGYKAYQGETVVVPFVTDFIRKQGWA
jgi:uncharacterized membrane protein